jgi:hypothetical protein
MSRPVLVEAIATAAAEALPAEPEQLELLAPTRFQPGEERHDAMVEAVKRQRGGRPLGARNIATREAVDFVRRVFGDPLIESARWLLHSPETMARELGCTKLEAFDRQESIRCDVRRYCYAPLAAVDARGNAVPPALTVVIGGREVVLSASGEELPPWERDRLQIEQNQEVSERDPEKSHDDQSQNGE